MQWAKQPSKQTAGKEDGEEVISPDGQYLMHMAAQSWLLLGGATKLNITQKRFLFGLLLSQAAAASKIEPGFSFEVWAELHYLQA